jgi:uncharacterized protein (DUF2147 family)
MRKLGFFLLATCAFAVDLTPVGRWKTIDDKTGNPKAIVQIYEDNGKLFGRIEQSLNPKASNVCDKCKNTRKGQPIVGLVIIRGLTKHGDEFSGGDILDPDNGSVYRCKMRVVEQGTKLSVRGFLGFSLLGRSQTWLREP